MLEKIEIARQIRHFFLNRKNKWVSEKELRGKNRLWQIVFNELIKQGFIEVKKTMLFDNYRWKENWKQEESDLDYIH